MGWTLLHAAALPMAVAIAYGGLDCLGVEAGKTVLINGAGTTVGFAAVQISLLRGDGDCNCLCHPLRVNCVLSALS